MPFPVDEAFIRAAEERLGLRLPRVLRDRLQRENGGEIEVDSEVWWLYPVRDDSDRRRLKRTTNDIVWETDQARQWDTFPATAVALGHDGGGNQLVLLPSADDSTRCDDTFHWWDHETGGMRPVSVTWHPVKAAT